MRLLLITALALGICFPAMAQTLSQDGYISIPKKDVQVVIVKNWKLFRTGTYVTINFAGVGLYNSDMEAYINQLFLPSRGQASDKLRAIVGDPVSFYHKDLRAGAIKNRNPVGSDRLLFTLRYDGDTLDLITISSQIEGEFENDNYKKVESSNFFYDAVYYIRK